MTKNMLRTQWQLSVTTLTLLLSVYYALILNYPIYLRFYAIFSASPVVSIPFAISIPVFLISALNIIFSLFNWRYVLKPFFILLTLTSAVVSYATTKYGVIFDKEMIQNIFETNIHEADSYLNMSFALWFLFLGVLPSLLLAKIKIIYPRNVFKSLLWRACSILVSAVIILIIGFFLYKDYASVGRNNSDLKKYIIPTYFVNNTYKYIHERYFTKAIPFQHLGMDAQDSARGAEDKPTLLVLVVGETARSQNYQLNGYPRPTNQYTQDLGVISFRHVRSCGTATAVSVPCMFSVMTHDNYDAALAHNQDGLLDILKHAGVSLLWKDNDGGCKGVCDRIPHESLSPDKSNPLCNGSTCYDEALLENFDNDIKNMKGDRVLTLHLIGSHGPTYYLRYPPSHRVFVPDCPRSDIENCDNAALRNTYDNTILYTDYVIAQIIKKLQALSGKYNTGLIYLSDHGESLGESGLYLHGTPYDLAPAEQTTVPLITWFSPGLVKSKELNLSCLQKEAATGQFSQGNLFHSVLGLMDIKTSVYQPELDLFHQCRNAL